MQSISLSVLIKLKNAAAHTAVIGARDETTADQESGNSKTHKVEFAAMGTLISGTKVGNT